MDHQQNAVTAQGREMDKHEATCISIISCQIRATRELEKVKSDIPTYLGRPWKIYATVVYIESYRGDHIDPAGWLEWNSTSPLQYLFYGEF